jgi:hypothetical protein
MREKEENWAIRVIAKYGIFISVAIMISKSWHLLALGWALF